MQFRSVAVALALSAVATSPVATEELRYTVNYLAGHTGESKRFSGFLTVDDVQLRVFDDHNPPSTSSLLLIDHDALRFLNDGPIVASIPLAIVKAVTPSTKQRQTNGSQCARSEARRNSNSISPGRATRAGS